MLLFSCTKVLKQIGECASSDVEKAAKNLNESINQSIEKF